MAVEVRLRAFKFVSHEKKDPSKQSQGIRKQIAKITAAVPARASGHYIPRTYTWFYNPLHDLESIWWIFKSSVLNKDIVCERQDSLAFKIEVPYIFTEETDRERKSRLLHHWRATRDLFFGRSSRADFAYSKGTLAKFLKSHPLHPAIRPLAGILEGMREALASQYQLVEENPSKIDHTSAGNVPEEFLVFLWDAWSHIRSTQCNVRVRSLGSQVEAIPQTIRRAILMQDAAREKRLAASGISQSSKRSRDADNDDLDDDSDRRSKSPRMSDAQTSPDVDVPSETVAPAKSKSTRTAGRRNAKRDPVKAIRRDKDMATTIKRDEASKKFKSIPPPVTRLLRSHARKAAEGTDGALPSAPPPQAPPRTARSTAQRKGGQKVTKNQQAIKAAAKVADKVKSKMRKGR